ncbi:MAG: S8 family serine peptidase, partial [Nocardioidaceae bacterium]
RVRQPRRLRHFLLAALATLLVTVGLATPAIGQPATAQGPAPHREGVTAGADPVDPGPVEATRVCEESSQPGEMACQALVRTDVRTHTGLMRASTPAGYGPEEIRDAYNLPDSGGEGVTVAIVDAFDNPNAEGDLAVWREQYGLPPCTTENGCFEKIDQRGGRDYPAPDRRWGMEIALDLDAVSAVCPQCNILLVEADDNYTHNLGAAVNQAVAQGADVVSNSYSGSESARNAEFDSTYYDHPGVAITASSGDDDYEVNYPAASQYVTAVGGTSLTPLTSAPRGWAEQVWSDGVDGAGSGCSAYEPKPSWQTDSGCDMRTVADVSAVADPATGLAVYNTYQHSGWTVGGGTSLSAPLIAAMYGLAGQPGSGDYPASYPYAHTGELYDVIAGNNGDCDPAYLCTGVPGYDGPTGLGTPNGVKALEPLGPHGEVTGTVTDAATGAPIDGAEVTAGDAVSRTDANGQYELV